MHLCPLGSVCLSVQTHRVPESSPHIYYRQPVPLPHLWAIWGLIQLLGCRHKEQALPDPRPCMNSLCSRPCVGRRPVLLASHGGISDTVTSFTHLKGPPLHQPLNVWLWLKPRLVICALPESLQQSAWRHTKRLGEARPQASVAFTRSAVSESSENLVGNKDPCLSPKPWDSLNTGHSFPRPLQLENSSGISVHAGAWYSEPPHAGSLAPWSAPSSGCQNAGASFCLKAGHPPSILYLPVPHLVAPSSPGA